MVAPTASFTAVAYLSPFAYPFIAHFSLLIAHYSSPLRHRKVLDDVVENILKNYGE